MPINAVEATHHGNAPRQHGAMEFSRAPVDLDAVRLYRLGRVRRELEARDYAGILLFDQINTRYATNATNMQIWSSHYETRCVLVLTRGDRKSTRLNSSHKPISYAVFCLKKKKHTV